MIWDENTKAFWNQPVQYQYCAETVTTSNQISIHSLCCNSNKLSWKWLVFFRGSRTSYHSPLIRKENLILNQIRIHKNWGKLQLTNKFLPKAASISSKDRVRFLPIRTTSPFAIPTKKQIITATNEAYLLPIKQFIVVISKWFSNFFLALLPVLVGREGSEIVERDTRFHTRERGGKRKDTETKYYIGVVHVWVLNQNRKTNSFIFPPRQVPGEVVTYVAPQQNLRYRSFFFSI